MHQYILNIRGIITVLAIFTASLVSGQSDATSNTARSIAMGQYLPYSPNVKKSEPYVNLDIQKVGITGYVKRVLPFGVMLLAILIGVFGALFTLFDGNLADKGYLGIPVLFGISWLIRWGAEATNYLIGPHEMIFVIKPVGNQPHKILAQAGELVQQYFSLLGWMHSIISIFMALIFGLICLIFIKQVSELFE
jgi:hypothetical protein